MTVRGDEFFRGASLDFAEAAIHVCDKMFICAAQGYADILKNTLGLGYLDPGDLEEGTTEQRKEYERKHDRLLAVIDDRKKKLDRIMSEFMKLEQNQ